jgi:hypothetical protein
MHPMFIVAIPIVLVIIGMVLNSTGLSFDQPPSSPEQDPAKRSVAELDAYRRFFDVQRKQAVKRQQRVSQYAWLLIIATIGSFIGLYMYTVNKTSVATRVVTVQTLPTEDGKETVLSITLKDSTNVKYLIKPPTGETVEAAKKEGLSKDKVSTYEISQLGTAFNLSDSPIAPGIAVKVSN